eukprot:610100-Pyramimonas_sp.AAC.1
MAMRRQERPACRSTCAAQRAGKGTRRQEGGAFARRTAGRRLGRSHRGLSRHPSSQARLGRAC